MSDVVDKVTRSRMMSGIKGKDTKPELQIRQVLHRRGFRYRLHVSNLPGKPDLVFPKYHAVIQIHGCFWHRHQCHMFKWPKSRTGFWQEKINANALRDMQNDLLLAERGWRVLTVWECSMKGKLRKPLDELGDEIVTWLTEREPSQSIP